MKRLLARSLGLAVCAAAHGDVALLAPDNTNLIIIALDPATGAKKNFEGRPPGDWLNLADTIDSFSIGMVRAATQVGSEVWISDQTSNLIYRFSAQFDAPRFLGSISSVLNPRGLAIINDEAWVASGTLNSTGGIVRLSTNGQPIGSFAAENPFDVFPNTASTVLVSNINLNRLERYNSASGNVGTFVGPWGTFSNIDFPMQIIPWNESGSDRILVVGFSGSDPGLYVYKASDGTFVKRILTIAIMPEVTVTDPRGVAVLGTGELAWSNSQGIFALTPGSGTNRILYTGDNFSCNFIESIDFSKYCSGDINNDSLVDDTDFSLFAVAYNDLVCPTLSTGYPAGCPADLNGDGFVDDTDFTMFISSYNNLVCP